MFSNVKGTRIATEFTPIFNSPPQRSPTTYDCEQKVIKIDEQIKGEIGLGDSKALDRLKKDSLGMVMSALCQDNGRKLN